MNISKEDIRKGYVLAVIIGVGFIMCLTAVGIVMYLLFNASNNDLSFQSNDYLIYILTCAAFAQYYLAKLIRNLILNQKAEMRMNGLPSPVSKLVTITIISFAISEINGILGVVFTVLTRKLLYMYLGIILSLCLYLLFFPRLNQWEELLQDMERNNL